MLHTHHTLMGQGNDITTSTMLLTLPHTLALQYMLSKSVSLLLLDNPAQCPYAAGPLMHTHRMLMGHKNDVGTSMMLLTSRWLPDTSNGGNMAPAAAAQLLPLPCCRDSNCPSTSRRLIKTLSAVLGLLSELYHKLSACNNERVQAHEYGE